MWFAVIALALLCSAVNAQDAAGTSSLTIAPCRSGRFPIACTTGFPGGCGCGPEPFPRPIPNPRPCACFLSYSPICGTDGRTYSNSCELRCTRAKEACKGACPCPKPPPRPPVPCRCTKEFRPVCGTDGVTYSNSCIARCSGASAQCKGGCPCKGKPSPPPPPPPPPPTDCIFSNGRFLGGCQPKGPPPSTPGQINNFLDECVKKGESASVAAARAACSTLKNKCPAVRPTAALASKNSFAGAAAGSFNPADALLEKVLEGACLTEAENSCKSKAFDNLSGSTCTKLLNSGPAQGVPGCRSLQDAVNIFNREVNRLCRKNIFGSIYFGELGNVVGSTGDLIFFLGFAWAMLL